MKRIVFLILLATCLITVTFARGTGERVNLNFGGSTTLLPIMESAIEAYAKRYPQVTISYEPQGSSVGIKGVIEGTYTLGASSRELRDSEIAAGAVATAIAMDGVAVIINKDIPISNLTIEQTAKMFTGQITNWKEVGGPDAKIILINRDEASGTRETFLETCLKPGAGSQAKFSHTAIIVESNGDMVQKVANTPYAIGYCGFGFIEGARKAGAKEITINGVQPHERNVLNHTYKLSRKLFVVHKGKLASGTIEKDFVDFLLSKEGQKIVKDQKFIPVK